MKLPYFLLFSFVSFIFSSSLERGYFFLTLTIKEEIPTSTSLEKLLATKHELVSSLNILKNEAEMTLLFKLYQTLNQHFKTQEVTHELLNQWKTLDNLPKDRFKTLISFLPELILKYQKFFYLYNNNRNQPNLTKDIKNFHALVSSKLQNLDDKILHMKRRLAIASCFEIDGISFEGKDNVPHLARRVKNFISMMVIESIKPMILNQLTSFETRLPLGSHQFTSLFAPVIDVDFFFVLQDIHITDIYFLKDTIPHPDAEGSIQRLVFPMDMIQNNEAFLHSKGFFKTFYSYLRMEKLVDMLPDSMQSEKNLEYNRNMWGYFRVCVSLLFDALKKNTNSKSLIKLSDFPTCTARFDQAVTTLQKHGSIKKRLSWPNQLGQLGIFKYFQQIYEKNYPCMFILNGLFLQKEKPFLKPSVLPPSSSLQDLRQQRNLYDEQRARNPHSPNRIRAANEQSKSNRSPRGKEAAGTSHEKAPSTSKALSHSFGLTPIFRQSSPKLTITVEKPKKHKRGDEMHTIDNSQASKKTASTFTTTFTVNQEPSSSYYETPIINPTDLAGANFQPSITDKYVFDTLDHISEFVDEDSLMKNFQHDATAATLFNSEENAQNVEEPSSSYYDAPIINPTDLVNTHFQQSVTNEDKFHESVYLSDLVDVDNSLENSEYDAATPSVFNSKESVQNEEALLNENAVDHSDIFEAARNQGPSSSHGGLEFWSPF